MKILSIETSCDETGISLIKGSGKEITLLGNTLASQIDIHAQYGGVFPALAKRAHAEKFIPLLTECLTEASLLTKRTSELSSEKISAITMLCAKDPILLESCTAFLSSFAKPDIDYIAVTTGPGLEPALWVGITAAKVLSTVWDIPLIPINHMEGHILVSLLNKNAEKQFTLADLAFPSLSLLVSGGHTELVLIEDYGSYKKIGQTVDDAVGEAFDKVARILGLPYPGGPAVSKLAAQARSQQLDAITMPRPMIHSGDYNFSYSGLKTAMLYKVREMTDSGARELTDQEKMVLAAAFEDAAIEVLVKKTGKAIEEYGITTLIVGGGVAANSYLRAQLTSHLEVRLPSTSILFPEIALATDNSVMIAIAAYVRAFTGHLESESLADMRADGNLSITDGGFRKEQKVL